MRGRPAVAVLVALALSGAAEAVVTPAAVAGTASTAPAQQDALPANDRRLVATSREGREIVARHYGSIDAGVQIVVIGQMHGSEPGGRKVAEELAARPIPEGLGLWIVVSMNPDGNERDTRGNARGVDLNRNFPARWQEGSRGTYWPGPRSASEPETRGMMAFLEAVRPTAVLSYHQAFDVVDISHALSRPAGRQLALYMGEGTSSVGCDGPCHGTMTQWIDRRLRTIAITVELDDRVSRAEAERAATAVLRLGRWLGR